VTDVTDKLFGIDVSKGVTVPVEHHRTRDRGKKPPESVKKTVELTNEPVNAVENAYDDFIDVAINTAPEPVNESPQRDVDIDVQQAVVNDEKGGV
jgi:hypothetical protein